MLRSGSFRLVKEISFLLKWISFTFSFILFERVLSQVLFSSFSQGPLRRVSVCCCFWRLRPRRHNCLILRQWIGDSYQMICVNFAPFQSGIPALFCNLFSAIYNRFSALLNGSKGSLRSGFSSYNRSPSRASLCRSFTAFSSSKWHSPYDI